MMQSVKKITQKEFSNFSREKLLWRNPRRLRSRLTTEDDLPAKSLDKTSEADQIAERNEISYI